MDSKFNEGGNYTGQARKPKTGEGQRLESH